MRALPRYIVVKREMSQKAKLSIYRSIFVSTLNYGDELWVVTKRPRLRVQATEMSFLPRVHCGEEGNKPKGEALDLPVNFHSYPHLWPRALGSDRKTEIVGTSG